MWPLVLAYLGMEFFEFGEWESAFLFGVLVQEEDPHVVQRAEVYVVLDQGQDSMERGQC